MFTTCGAKSRTGKPCKLPPVTGKRRCRMHGGAAGSGAPKGNKNALKSGLYTRAMIKRRREDRAFFYEAIKHIGENEY